MSPLENHLRLARSLSEGSLPARTLVDRIIEEFVDAWVLHCFILPTNDVREDFKMETIQKLEELIRIFHELDFSRISITEWEVLDTIDEESKSTN
jgi:hypothetical protein